jgi:hypothetical protein
LERATLKAQFFTKREREVCVSERDERHMCERGKSDEGEREGGVRVKER